MLADEFDKKIEIVHAADDVDVEPTYDDDEADLVERPPVVTIMGHVDHGKTSLLDAIRETEVDRRRGRRHHAAHRRLPGAPRRQADHVPRHAGPRGVHRHARPRRAGHRHRVIVVAADDGVKPQTEEAIDHAQGRRGADRSSPSTRSTRRARDPTRVRTEMTQLELQPAEWGGDIEFVDVSAKTKQGLDDLLDTIQVVTDLQELKANPDADASGARDRVQARPRPRPGRHLLIQRGTLRVGDALVAGSHWGKVRAMNDYTGKPRQAGASPATRSRCSASTASPRRASSCAWSRTTAGRASWPASARNRLKTEALARRSGRKVSLRGRLQARPGGRVQGAQPRAQGRRGRLAGGDRGRDRQAAADRGSRST